MVKKQKVFKCPNCKSNLELIVLVTKASIKCQECSTEYDHGDKQKIIDYWNKNAK